MTELWDLYNEERKKTGTILRGTPIPKGQYHLVISAWIVNSKGQYLLSQRHPNKAYPYFWECTGGSVLAGEDSLNGALREVKEELGITLEAEHGKLIYQSRREKTQDFYDVWLFYADIDTAEITLQETEVVAVQWVNRDCLFDMYQSGKLHPLIDYIHEII
jgi:8-oxo-dGTP pyrophosphatase MutT (NUDIX family)